MQPDSRYRKNERALLVVASVLGLFLVAAASYFSKIPQSPRIISEEAVWAFVEAKSSKHGLDPEFVYAIVWAESSLNARARSPVARGMMQLTKLAWEEVTDESYRMAWDWKTNIRVGIGYLVFCREFLKKRESFSYPLLAACYRYGPYYVQRQDFDFQKIREPRNKIYRSIFEGNIRPVSPPLVAGI